MKTKEKFNISAYLLTAISLGSGGSGQLYTISAGRRLVVWTEISRAHKTLPFGTKLRVIYNDKSVIVRINDRGPYVGKRIIDLSKGAADKLGLTDKGVGHLRLEKCR